jgi:hypothetical protein
LLTWIAFYAPSYGIPMTNQVLKQVGTPSLIQYAAVRERYTCPISLIAAAPSR